MAGVTFWCVLQRTKNTSISVARTRINGIPIKQYLQQYLDEECAKKIAKLWQNALRLLNDVSQMQELAELVRDNFPFVNDRIVLLLSEAQLEGSLKILGEAYVLLAAVVMSFVACLESRRYRQRAVDALTDYCKPVEEAEAAKSEFSRLILEINRKLARLHQHYVKAVLSRKEVQLSDLARAGLERVGQQNPLLLAFIQRLASLMKKHTRAQLIAPLDFEKSVAMFVDNDTALIKLGGAHVMKVEVGKDTVHLEYNDHAPARLRLVACNLMRMGCKVRQEYGKVIAECPKDVFSDNLTNIALLFALTTTTDTLIPLYNEIERSRMCIPPQGFLRLKFRYTKGREPSEMEEMELSSPD